MARKRNQQEESATAVADVEEVEELEVDETEKPETFTPTQLAEALNVDPKRLRAYLRANFTRDPAMKGKSWHLSAEVAAIVIEHFTTKEDEVVELDDMVSEASE